MKIYIVILTKNEHSTIHSFRVYNINNTTDYWHELKQKIQIEFGEHYEIMTWRILNETPEMP